VVIKKADNPEETNAKKDSIYNEDLCYQIRYPLIPAVGRALFSLILRAGVCFATANVGQVASRPARYKSCERNP
jgi:hypothetical protein